MDLKLIALNRACDQAAQAVVEYLAGAEGTSPAWLPAELEQAILDDKPLVLEALGRAPQGAFAAARTLFGGIGQEFGRSQKSNDGTALGHPYMWILQRVAGAAPEHAEVVLRHLPWWRQQCDEARRIVFGDGPPPAAAASPPQAPEPEPQEPAAPPEPPRPQLSPPSI